MNINSFGKSLFNIGTVAVEKIELETKFLKLIVKIHISHEEIDGPIFHKKVKKSIASALKYLKKENFIPDEPGWKLGLDIITIPPNENGNIPQPVPT